MELVKVKLSYTNPNSGESKTLETYAAVYPDFGEYILRQAAIIAINGTISSDPSDWESWQVVVDSAERIGTVHVEPDK